MKTEKVKDVKILLARIERILYEKPSLGQDFYFWVGKDWDHLKKLVYEEDSDVS